MVNIIAMKNVRIKSRLNRRKANVFKILFVVNNLFNMREYRGGNDVIISCNWWGWFHWF